MTFVKYVVVHVACMLCVTCVYVRDVWKLCKGCVRVPVCVVCVNGVPVVS